LRSMVTGRYLTAPIIVFNLVGEMVYVLYQRLTSQSVSA
jgi:hypothetical protein